MPKKYRIKWIDCRRMANGVKMEGKNLVIIVVTALICLTSLVVYALSQGVDGAIYGSAIGIFGVIIGAIAKAIYDKKP